jgi:hypothetical protein
MIMNMRTASYMGKIMANTYFAASAGEVFEAATVGSRSAATISGGLRQARLPT